MPHRLELFRCAGMGNAQPGRVLERYVCSKPAVPAPRDRFPSGQVCALHFFYCIDPCALAGACVLSDERRLVLYALHQQATVGPCTASKPWRWNAVEAAKYDAWSQMGNMSSMEAMRLYVKALEEDQVAFLCEAPYFRLHMPSLNSH